MTSLIQVNYSCVGWAFVMRHPGTDVTEQAKKHWLISTEKTPKCVNGIISTLAPEPDQLERESCLYLVWL